MAQEFTINSSAIETKINQLLPSQGGFGAGVDFSASTMVIPIIDLTESAEGSVLRQDLQTAFSHDTVTQVNVTNSDTTIANTPGYYRLNVVMNGISSSTGSNECYVFLFDGTTNKFGQGIALPSPAGVQQSIQFDCVYCLEAGDSLKIRSTNGNTRVFGFVRQIADISGNLTSPV